MQREKRTEEQTIRSMRTAGLSFIGMRLGEVLENIDNYDTSTFRNAKIDEFFENQNGYRDSKITGTKTRLSATLTIIRSGWSEYALEATIFGTGKIDQDARSEAKKTLERLRSGNLVDPFSS